MLSRRHKFVGYTRVIHNVINNSVDKHEFVRTMRISLQRAENKGIFAGSWSAEQGAVRSAAELCYVDENVVDNLGHGEPPTPPAVAEDLVHQLHRHRRRFAAADAEGGEASALVVGLEGAEQGGEEAGA